MAKLEPIFTSLFSVWMLNEILSVHQYFGIVLVVSSLAVYQILRRAKKAEAQILAE